MDSLSSTFVGNKLRDWHPAHFSAPQERFGLQGVAPVDEACFSVLRAHLKQQMGKAADLDELEDLYKQSTLPARFSRIFFILYSPGHKRIIVSRDYGNGTWTFSSVFKRLLDHPRRLLLTKGEFFLQIDFVEAPPSPVDYFSVGMLRRGRRHFEIGVDGLSIELDEKRYYFLPGDCYVRSIMSMKQLREYLERVYGEEQLRNADFFRYRTKSFLVSPNGASMLYRGIPMVGDLTKSRVEQSIELAVDHIKRTQESNGKFLYYYEPVADSVRDFEHPGRKPGENLYYNILRHSGGGLACLYYEKYTGSGRSLENMRLAIEYLLQHAKFYTINGSQAAYIYSERKSKLGGAGIGLYFLAEYQLLTGDNQYQYLADAIALHTLNQILDTGEFMYYNIYLDKEVTAAENNEYFSFYYPGEAICGLAKYLHLVPEESRTIYFEKMKLALEYLIVDRPLQRAGEYTKVPSDSWLMMGIMELWDFEEMHDSRYSDFVFSDARKMIDRMYKVSDAPYPDYAGAFHYNYGDYPYADGARLEGLLGAYELAHKMGNKEIQECLWKALRLGAWAVAHLVNTPEAIYCAVRPEWALGGIRFKYTRQWFRIDTIQHVACFYAKLLPYWDEAERGQSHMAALPLAREIS